MDISPSSSCDINDRRQPWRIGQVVDVQPRTWAGINRQGGTGKITAIHDNGNLDIKYILCGFDKNLPPHLVAPHAVLERTTRRRQQQQPPRGGTAAVVEVESMPEDGSSSNGVDEMRAGKPAAAQRKEQLVKTTKRSKKLKKAAAASSVRSTPSACSSTGSSIVTYVPKEIAVPVAHRHGVATTHDKNPPLFSPLTVAGDGAVRKKKPTTMASSSSSSAGAGPPSVIEECYMSDDNEPSALGRTSTATNPNTDGPSAMMLDSPRNDKDAPIEDEFSTTEAPYCTKNKLRGVFEDDRKNASQFIESVVESSQDLNRFSSLLNQALLQNDGALDLADLAHYVVDDSGGPAYSDDQIQHFLQHLCAQNKIMRSDDVIYSM